MVEVKLSMADALYESVRRSSREAGLTVEEYLADLVRARERSEQDELAIAAYQALAEETLEFAESAMATVRETWPRWGEEAQPQRARIRSSRPAAAGTCRGEILDAVQAIVRRNGRPEFTMQEVVEEMKHRGSEYAESSIRTHVGSIMCANAPRNHGTAYQDLERVEHGRYRLIPPAEQEDSDDS